MAFWKQNKPIPITNKQQLTASQQKNILKSAKLSSKDIQELKKTTPDKSLLNPGRRISLNKMKQAIKKSGKPKLADKINKAFSDYQKQAEEYVEKFCQEQYEASKIKGQISEKVKSINEKTWEAEKPKKTELNSQPDNKIKANIKKTREYDRKRERSEEYMQERMTNLGWTENKSSSVFKKNKPINPNQSYKNTRISAAHWNKNKANVSAAGNNNNYNKKNKVEKTTNISEFEKLKEEAENLPDLPI